MGTADTARTAVGIIGNVMSFLLFASPTPTFHRIFKKKSVEEFKPDPYIAGVINCVFWVLYGLPIVHPDSILVLSINAVGLVLQLSYLSIFFWYCTNKKQRWKVIGCLCAEVVFTGAIACTAILVFHTHEARSNFVGAFCVVFSIILYSAPLTIMKKVIKTKSVEFMPFWLSLAAFANGIVWSVYALIKIDPYVLTPNGTGALLGAAQLFLYAYYYKSTPKGDEKKQFEVQLQAAV